MSKKSIDCLTAHEQEVLSHVARYRMTVREAITKVVVHPRGSTAVARRWLNRLVEDGALGTAPLYRNRRYFYLTQEGASRVDGNAGIHQPQNHGPLSEPAKIRAYAMLAWCCLQNKPREGLSRDDFQTHFSDLYRPGLAMNYYIDTNGERPRLGFLRIDMGGRGRWDRIVEKARHDVEVHALSRGFRNLIRNRSFEITIVTALPQKAERIRQALFNNRITTRIDVHVVSIPDLLHLVLPPPIEASLNR